MKPLSWQVCCCVVCGIFLGVMVCFVFNSQGDPTATHIGVIGLCITTPIMFLLILSEIRNNHGSDSAPDVLGELFEENQIFQGGDAQFVFVARQVGRVVRVYIVVQNLREREGMFYFKAYTPQFKRCPLEIPILRNPIGAATVVRLSAEIPVPPIATATRIQLRFSGTADAKGRRVRFANRQAVPSGIAHLAGVDSLIGAVVEEAKGQPLSGTYQMLDLFPAEGSVKVKNVSWTATVLWDPKGLQKIDEIGRSLGSDVELNPRLPNL